MVINVISSNRNERNTGMCKLETTLVAASTDDDGRVIITTNNLIQQI